MKYYFAPMEGITGAVFRRTHHEFFPGIDKYFMPFITPTTQPGLTPRQKREVLPEYNEGVPAVPQLLTKTAADFIWAANLLGSLGWGEVNLNLGCPSGTVTAKGKGAGFLAHPDELDRFLDEIFSACTVPVSIKTRLGVHEPEEFDHLLEIYNRYPICELTIHPRVRQDFYKGRVREDAFAAALPHCPMPVCYNGDLVSERGIRETIERYPALSALMLGRGLLGDPSLVTRVRGGERADSALYAHLAARMKGRAQAMLRAIAQQEACHAKKLAAVYFLNTGKKACPGRPERPCVTCINETLRQQYTAEHAAHEAYAALAENAGTHRCMLLRMAQEECEHAQLILCILQNCL